jgi:hypothetical protein
VVPEIGALRPVEINPEELAGREQTLDSVPAEVDLPVAALAENVALRRRLAGPPR